MSAKPIGKVKYAGADGCKHGCWFAFLVNSSGEYRPGLFRDLSSLFDACRDAKSILLDVPIGLSDTRRECDVIAKDNLRPHGSRVFYSPPRKAIQAASWDEANACSRELSGSGMSKQTWAISPRIMATDDFLQGSAKARKIVRECHPEICFWALNGKQVVAERKKSEPGRQARIRLLKKFVPSVDRLVAESLRLGCRHEFAKDDVIDALVAAVTAAAPKIELHTLPSNPPLDSYGLRMEMVYRVPPKPRRH